MSNILKFDFRKREQLRFPEVNYLNYTKKPNFACGNYILPKTRGNKNKPWTHSTPLNMFSDSSLSFTYVYFVAGPAWNAVNNFSLIFNFGFVLWRKKDLT